MAQNPKPQTPLNLYKFILVIERILLSKPFLNLFKDQNSQVRNYFFSIFF